MPDVWTHHPDIVRDLLKEAGFTCGVQGRFLQGRDPEWTCVFDGKTMRGDLYIHQVAQQRSDLQVSPAVEDSPGAELGAPALAVLLVAAVAIWAPRGRRVTRDPGASASSPGRRS